ncbi:cell wall hydrolase [Mediterraneibacter sp.]|uniref:cell wall hydrolase n=1 Tax=Mediterraneibacter sp. TaxID=2316022 RepID=UPI0027B9A545|nr:cell wall hydrolase [Mediterraneibacter sp.]
MNYNKKRIFAALYITVSSVMLLTGFTSPVGNRNSVENFSYAGSETAVQVSSIVADDTIGVIKGTEKISKGVQTAGDMWKTESVRIEEAIRAEEARLAEEARIAEEQAMQAAAQETMQSEAANVMAGEQELLAALIYCEAGNQPYEGQVAVGAVVMNRVRSGSYPNTISEVIYQSGQFGPAMTGWLDSVLASGGYTQTAMQAAADALAGSNPVGDCLSFGNGNWGLQIGDHFFH